MRRGEISFLYCSNDIKANKKEQNNANYHTGHHNYKMADNISRNSRSIKFFWILCKILWCAELRGEKISQSGFRSEVLQENKFIMSGEMVKSLIVSLI